jgi:hypothetical protein
MKFCLLLLFLVPGEFFALSQVAKGPTESRKTACIKLLTGSQKDAAAAEAEIRKSTKFSLAEDCSRADMTVWISAGSPAMENLCRATVQAIGTDQKILWTQTRTCKATTAPAVAQMTRRMLLDLGSPKKSTKASHH